MAKKTSSKQQSRTCKPTSEQSGAATRDTAESTDDWISALAKKAATEAGPVAALPSKAERIERRNAKKRRREERKPSAHGSSHETQNNHLDERQETSRTNRRSEAYLKSLARTLHHCVATLEEKSLSPRRPYLAADALKKGKATAGNKLDEEIVQPRRRDYGGLGLARPSLYIGLRDPSFVPKLEEEFAEHVPGFFGKQRTKAMKRQLDGNMLWRQLAEKRTDDRKLGGKKLSDMSPDERVEAMIKAGMI